MITVYSKESLRVRLCMEQRFAEAVAQLFGELPGGLELRRKADELIDLEEELAPLPVDVEDWGPLPLPPYSVL